MDSTTLQTLFIALAVGVASGSIGSFIILKRMALVGDALSHVALPGIALALAYHADPFFGVLIFLLLAAVLIWFLEGKTKLPTDAIVGLLFTASLAVGILTIPDTEILESLFGTFPIFQPFVFFLVLGAALLLSIASFLFARRFLFAIVSPELSRVEGGGRRFDLFLLLIFSFVVALGIKLAGTLLMGALTIIPAATAKNISLSTKGYMFWSAFLGGAVSVVGAFLALRLGLLPGPTIILLGVGFFLVSLFFARK
ncbi:MAG: metal ABC transporter permease [Candidatus Sungiibacteriota bacterium]|uniref:Metal ABC transporter permease n=1 Tax=Candidatus Sungiibacteriota bacterium TaxID=2750080 RepID=A0A7T5RJR2_9BACT|nr:MAG: metal ABC transporter permease [Candidatus Sungbacteria bacterium]